MIATMPLRSKPPIRRLVSVNLALTLVLLALTLTLLALDIWTGFKW